MRRLLVVLCVLLFLPWIASAQTVETLPAATSGFQKTKKTKLVAVLGTYALHHAKEVGAVGSPLRSNSQTFLGRSAV